MMTDNYGKSDLFMHDHLLVFLGLSPIAYIPLERFVTANKNSQFI